MHAVISFIAGTVTITPHLLLLLLPLSVIAYVVTTGATATSPTECLDVMRMKYITCISTFYFYSPLLLFLNFIN